MRTLVSWAGIALLALVAFLLSLLAFGLLIAPAANAAPVSSHLQLRLPVHEHPGGQVKAPLRPLGRNGLPAKPSKLALR
jgi:hypothetical protein